MIYSLKTDLPMFIYSRILLLFWDPELSHYKMDDFENDLTRISQDYYMHLEWGINNPQDIVEGTPFFIIKLGNGNCGMVMMGRVLADCLFKEDHKRYCRKYFKTDYDAWLYPVEMYHPDRSDIITIEQLMEILPEIPYDYSIREVLLTKEQSAKFAEIYENFMANHPDIFKPIAGVRIQMPHP